MDFDALMLFTDYAISAVGGLIRRNAH